MKEVDRAICLELEKALSESEDKSFVEILYELGVIDANLDMNESSDSTWERMSKKLSNAVPKTPLECISVVEKICDEAVRTYDNEEFYEDDCDRFLGESILAQRVLDIIGQFRAYAQMLEETSEKQ